MTTTLDGYHRRRDELLAKIGGELAVDERFAASWLTGSYARGNADALSDIDITIVVLDPYSEVLCQRVEQVSSQTSPERYTLFSQFGEPALIHENNHNAPEGGTFTFVLYSESAAMIDWILIPQSKAKRPAQSILLFEKDNIPITPPPAQDELEQSKKTVAEDWAFFWMMTAITIKYILRGDGVYAVRWIESLTGMVREIERQLDREPWKYVRGSLSSLQTTRPDQVESIRELCSRMMQMKARVSEFLGEEPLTPTSEIETFLQLAQGSNPQSQSFNLKSSI